MPVGLNEILVHTGVYLVTSGATELFKSRTTEKQTTKCTVTLILNRTFNLDQAGFHVSQSIVWSYSDIERELTDYYINEAICVDYGDDFQ